MANHASAATPSADASGPLRRLGRYELLCEIASGGMATVFLARVVAAAGFERVVAVKCCHPHLRGEDNFTPMFLDEARLAARIYHPNVVATLDVSDGEDGELYLVMEHIEGGNLLALLRASCRMGGRVPTDIALRIVLDMLSGLHCAHELCDDTGASLGIVHRDVSPQNVLVGVDGVTRITDFGIAKAAARLGSTGAGKLKGKLAYMSPEQYGEGAVTRQSDVFAAGVVMWEVLAGQRLFGASTDAMTIKNVLRGATRAPSSAAADVPRALDEIVLRALSRDPAQRFASASELADAIEATGLPIASTRKVGKYVEDLLGESIDGRRKLLRSLHVTGNTATGVTPASPMTPTSTIARPELEAANTAAAPSRGVRPLRRRSASLLGRVVVAFGAACLASFMIVKLPSRAAHSTASDVFGSPREETPTPQLVPDFAPTRVQPAIWPDAGGVDNVVMAPAVAVVQGCAPAVVLPAVTLERRPRHRRHHRRALPLY